MTTDTRHLSWAHGDLTVQTLGAMLGPVHFELPDGRRIAPLHVAPWADAPGTETLPGILQRLRGEWPCVPFGAEGAKDLTGDWAALGLLAPALPEGAGPHGESSNQIWEWQPAPPGTLRLALDYPADHPIARVERQITPDPGGPAIELTLIVHPRRDCRLPIGLHPVLRLPDRVGAARIVAGRYRDVRSFPGTLEPGAALFAPDAVFTDLALAPGRGGGTLDASRLPFPGAGEDLLQLLGCNGRVSLLNEVENTRVDLNWNPSDFPSLLIWFSNRGRTGPPWSGRHLALGLEPVCAAFDLGVAASAAPNPINRSGIPTAHQFRAGQTFTTHYRIAAAIGGAE